jgi:hypothetical protein
MFFATIIVFNAGPDTVHPPEFAPYLRIIAAVLDVALPVAWWLWHRRLDPAVAREDVEVVRPLGGTRLGVRSELVDLTIAAALLATERAGDLEFKTTASGLLLHFRGASAAWPSGSLEDRLQRARTISVAHLIFDWLADGSNFPLKRVFRIIEHSATLRRLDAGDTAFVNSLDPAPVENLLRECRQSRPSIWDGVLDGIAAAIQARTVPPRIRETPAGGIPEYDYQEGSLESLDASDPVARQPDTPAAWLEPRGAKQVFTYGYVVTLTVLLCATGFTLFFRRENTMSALVIAALIGSFELLVLDVRYRRKVDRLLALRKSHGLPLEPVTNNYFISVLRGRTKIDHILSNCLLPLVAALLAAIWNPWTVLFPLLVMGIAWFVATTNFKTLKEKTTSEIVATRVKELAAVDSPMVAVAAVSSSGESFPESPSSASLPCVPEQPLPAHDLPPAPAEVNELLDRWSRRRAVVRRVYWISFAALVGGYSALVLAFWYTGARSWFERDNADIGYFPTALIFTLLPTGMLVASYFMRRDKGNSQEESNSRHAGIARAIALWRLIILIEAPLLFYAQDTPEARARHPYFAAAALLFLTGHWFATEWAISRTMRRFPLPGPRRLVMLRVFGSPSFDDLVALIRPWLRVGLIEHLEGYDTVGKNREVQAAVDTGDVDRVLVTNFAEMRLRMARASADPDSALLFQRHTFQCTEATWHEAIQAMLGHADAVLMDLSSLSETNQGCAWELAQLLRRVPLSQVTLLVNDSTDLACLRRILDDAARRMPPDSANWNQSTVAWRLIRVGGLAARQPGESYYDWHPRLDERLDPMSLTAWLLTMARAPHCSVPVTRWGRQSRWKWLVFLALSAFWAFSNSLR